MLTDKELIQTFIEDTLMGREVLLANKNFKSESLHRMNHLISKREGILIKVDVLEFPITFSVRSGSSYEDLLHEVFRELSFITADRAGSSQFYQYRRFQVLPGYKVNCETASHLWKSWRLLSRMSRHFNKAQALLIQGGYSWTEVQSMTVSNELLFINTPEGEVVAHMTDPIFWLSQPELSVNKKAEKPSHLKRRFGLG